MTDIDREIKLFLNCCYRRVFLVDTLQLMDDNGERKVGPAEKYLITMFYLLIRLQSDLMDIFKKKNVSWWRQIKLTFRLVSDEDKRAIYKDIIKELKLKNLHDMSELRKCVDIVIKILEIRLEHE